MGFLSKIFKPVSKVLDKIIPNEAKPFLPYAAAFAPMFAPGIMGLGGGSMLSRGLISGGLNLGSQLAQEGSEGDFNPLSVLMAGGIGALSTPGTTGGRTLPDGSGGSYSQVMGGDKLASVGNQSAGEYLSGLSDTGSFGDKGLEFLAKGADKLSALNAAGVADPFSSAGLKASVLPFAQATGDLAYADAQRALRDFEDSQGGGSGYAEGDQNRGLAVRRAMERGGHEEQTIQDMLESLGYADPDPQPLAYGGRVGLREGGLSMMGQMDLLGNNQSRPMHLGMQNTPGFGEMGGGNNSPIFPRLDELQSGVSQAENSLQDINGRLGAPNGGSLSFLQAQKPGLQMNMSRIPEGLKMSPNRTMPFMNGGRVEFGMGGDIMDGIMNMISKESKDPDFGGIPEAVDNIQNESKEYLFDNKLKFEVGPGENEQMSVLNALFADEEGIIPEDRKQQYYNLYINDLYRSGEIPRSDYDGYIEEGILTKPKYNMGGSVLPQGMEMDYRQGGMIPMGSAERADDVPARVSKNEFVMTADAVRAAGGGSVNKGAQKMYQLMNNLEAKV